MTLATCFRSATAILLLASGSASAALVQVGDFRLNANAVGSTFTPYDTYSFPTRGVTGAPAQVTSTFAGTSQNNDGTVVDGTASNQDVTLQTFSAATNVRTLSRFASTAKAGAASWTFSLAPVATYATTNAQTVNAVTARLATTVTAGYTYDVYLSYTSAADGLTQTPISTSPDANYATFVGPARTANVGDKVGGAYVLLAKDVSTSLDLSTDLTSLYAAGTRDFTLVIASASFGSARILNINANSGVFIDTSAAVPEPATGAVVIGLAAAGLLRRHRGACGTI